jgi:hypothetical protein
MLDMIEDLDVNFMMDLKTLSLRGFWCVMIKNAIFHILPKTNFYEKYNYVDIVTVHGCGFGNFESI